MMPQAFKEEETILLSVIAMGNQLTVIINDSPHAKAYFDFLKREGVVCTKPKPASFNVLVFGLDGKKERTIVKATNTFQFVAKGDEEEWKKWTNKWMSKYPNSGKFPNLE